MGQAENHLAEVLGAHGSPGRRRVPVIYLAGGMRSGWQDRVKKAFPGVLFIDPREHGLKDEAGYTAWDLTGVDLANIVFGYIEKDNPNGAGLALEFGYAARDEHKILIYAEEAGFPFSRYFGMVRAVSHYKADSLEAGMDWLRMRLESLGIGCAA